MFTIKCLFDGGHAVYECAAYRLRQPGIHIGECIADRNYPSLDMMDAEGSVTRSFTINGTVYAMNAAGKTVDTFHAPPQKSVGGDPNSTDGLGHPLGVG